MKYLQCYRYIPSMHTYSLSMSVGETLLPQLESCQHYIYAVMTLYDIRKCFITILSFMLCTRCSPLKDYCITMQCATNQGIYP